MTTWTRICRAPMPRPWTARKAISIGVFWAKPQANEATRKMPMATSISSFLLNRSASLPQIGVEAVVVSSAAVTTQVYCDWVPFSAPMIWGSATDTIVLLIIAMNRTRSRPLSASSTCRWLFGPASGSVGALTRSLQSDG
ncbi:UNVERIFIED_ORG: hypothetical protein FHR35_003473 [Microbispora rosea subsp. rosea]